MVKTKEAPKKRRAAAPKKGKDGKAPRRVGKFPGMGAAASKEGEEPTAGTTCFEIPELPEGVADNEVVIYVDGVETIRERGVTGEIDVPDIEPGQLAIGTLTYYDESGMRISRGVAYPDLEWLEDETGEGEGEAATAKQPPAAAAKSSGGPVIPPGARK